MLKIGVRPRVLFMMLVLALVAGSVAMAATSPAEALDATAIATAGKTDLQGLVTDALPFITAAIGLAIVLRWVRKVFRF